jgi:hypothetical protein
MIEQFFIAATELVAMYLMQSNKYTDRKYSSIFGLLGQPFWFYASFTHQQWGSFIIGFFFTALWLKNFHSYWINPKPERMKPKEYHFLIMDAVKKIKSSNLDKEDYIDRVLKEALHIK